MARKKPPKRSRTQQAVSPATDNLLTLSEAARAVGVSKSTIWRAIKTGRLSIAAKTADGEFRVEPSELERAFAERKRAATAAKLVRSDTAVAERINALEAMLAFAKEQLEKAENDRDAWRTQAEASQRLLTGETRKRWRWFG